MGLRELNTLGVAVGKTLSERLMGSRIVVRDDFQE